MRIRVAVIAIALAIVGCGPDDRAPSDAHRDSLGGGSDAANQGQFGDPCTHHTDCTSGYCVEPAAGEGGVCSRPCANDCPGGYDCLPVAFPDGNVNLCVPSAARLCQACASDGECPGGACLTIDGSPHCGATCADTTQCPNGYTCATDAQGTHSGKFCQPTTASCTCNAQMSGAMRTC